MKYLRAYQQIASDRGTRENLLIADACGTGKTITGIDIVKRVRYAVAKPVFIVVPSGTVKLQWYNALIEQLEVGACDYIQWVDSSTRDWLVEPGTIILTHYEAMRKHIKKLSTVTYSLVVADEAHRIKNRKTQRTTALKSIKADKKIALTGTPYTTPSDVWSIFNWLYPQFFTSYWRFFDAHINYIEKVVQLGFSIDVKTFNGIRNDCAKGFDETYLLDKYKLTAGKLKSVLSRGQVIKEVQPNALRDPANFARLMRQFTIQRTKEDVRADLPPKIETYVQLEMGSTQANYYRKLLAADDPIVELADGVETSVSIVLTQILRKTQITSDPALLGLPTGASVKLDWVREWLEDNPNESVLIATRFRAVAEQLAKELDGFTLVVGGKRGTIDSSVRRIVGTISAMSEGLDLPHIDNTICIDTETSPILMQQLMDRTHRINIDVPKNIYYLQCVNTVDALVDMCWRSHWNTAELVKHYLNGRESELTP